MFTIEMHTSRVHEKSGTSRLGNPFKIREQPGFIFLNDEPYPQKVTIPLEHDQAPYPIGQYSLEPEFYVGQYGDLRVGMRNASLTPVKKEAMKAGGTA